MSGVNSDIISFALVGKWACGLFAMLTAAEGAEIYINNTNTSCIEENAKEKAIRCFKIAGIAAVAAVGFAIFAAGSLNKEEDEDLFFF